MADKNPKRPAGQAAKNRRAANKRKNDAAKMRHNDRIAEALRAAADPWVFRYRSCRSAYVGTATPAVIHPGARPRPRKRPAPNTSDFGKWFAKLCDRVA